MQMVLFPAENSIIAILKNMDSISCKTPVWQGHTAHPNLAKIYEILEIKHSDLTAT